MADAGGPRRVVIMGAGGRDFHDFNVLFRDDPTTRVVAFTAAQIPFQGGRLYPSSLAGSAYPDGIPILPEEQLPEILSAESVDEVILAYSDLSHQQVMEAASRVLALGADFRLVAPERTMLVSRLPVISVCAVRTGCGKSPVTRYLCRRLRSLGRNPVVVRHPMAYGDLELRAAQRFDHESDLERYGCTIEEREEYEPLIRAGVPLFAGVDYQRVLKSAEAAGDVLIWDGGNNDAPFVRPDLEVVLVDPCRTGDEAGYFPGLLNLLRAGVVVVTKVAEAGPQRVAEVCRSAVRFNPRASVTCGELVVHVEEGTKLRGRKVVVVEDGPTLTHGGMAYGAGVVAARRFGAEVVDPRPFAVGTLAETFRAFPHLFQVVPAMGYSPAQLEDLRHTLEAIPCDLVLSATPVDLSRLLHLSRSLVRVSYEFIEEEGGALEQALRSFLAQGDG